MKLDRTTRYFLVVALAAGAACAWLRGMDSAVHAVRHALETLIEILPSISAGFLLAGLIQVLVPRELVSRWMGAGSGRRGLLIAMVAGMITPGGPFSAFPLVYAMGQAGADIGVLVSFLTAWSTIGLHRLLVWEIPFLGIGLPLMRFLISLPMAVAAGMLARHLATRFPDPSATGTDSDAPEGGRP